MVNLQSVVGVDDINDIGPGCYIYVLDLGFELKILTYVGQKRL